MENNVPNFDGMIPSDLKAWADEFDYGPIEYAIRKIFPVQYEELRQAVLNLVKYADFKTDAMLQRSKGNIPLALDIEKKCDEIYEQLPGYARW